MAFQSGSQIRPELANADYSGFTNAANIQANAMANLGQSIASGIEGYRERKKEKTAGRAKIKRAEALGDSMISMFQENNPGLANNIADIMSMNFDESIPLDQRIEATDGFEQSLMNMFLMNQQSQAPTFTPGPEGGMMVRIGGKDTYFPPQAMGKGPDPMAALYNALGAGTTPVTPPPALTPDELEEEARLMREAQLNQ